jgi:hypothetical protein
MTYTLQTYYLVYKYIIELENDCMNIQNMIHFLLLSQIYKRNQGSMLNS